MKNKLLKQILALISIAFFLVSVGFTSVQPDQDGRGRGDNVDPFSALSIPEGQLPPSEERKIWIPGQQGQPQSHETVPQDDPLGAEIIRIQVKDIK